MEIEWVVRIAFMVLASAIMTGASFKMLQILQLSGYRHVGYVAWFRQTRFDYVARYFALAFLSFILMFVFCACFEPFVWVYHFGMLLFLLMGVLFIRFALSSEKKGKTPLKLTRRVWRLILVETVLNAGILLGLLVLGAEIPIVDYALAGAGYFLIPLSVLLAHWLTVPVEMFIQSLIKNRTRKKLTANPQLIKIGITGSFGKTTAKNILAAMLAKKYRVCATPASFNTPMGIARCVQDSAEFASAEVFIAEMGARHRGDIAELCSLVAPSIGMLTGIGTQHLETFGSVRALASTKYELVASLSNGHAFFNGENEGTRKLFDLCNTPKTLSGEGGTVGYENYRLSENGTAFTLVADGQKVSVQTKLLGKHIPSLVALCAAVALHLGLSLQEIAQGVADCPPVAHRLQLVDSAPNMVVIDDAYNANPEGAKNALEVLSAFDGTRILVTPGLVELGSEEADANTELGRLAAKHADYAIFNSSRAVFLKKGALEAGMAEECVFVVDSLASAMEVVKGIEAERKVILFENDLPDNMM